MARKLLSAVYRTGQRFGAAHVAAVLAGEDNEKVRKFGHDRLSVFGICEPDELTLVRPVVQTLQARDALRTAEHGGLAFGPAARAILNGNERIDVVLPPPTKRQRRRAANAAMDGDPLFEALRAERRRLAGEAGVPPYVIFHDSTLRGIAEVRPRSLDELGQISGVGTAKLERFGAAMLAVVRRLEEEAGPIADRRSMMAQ